MDSDRLDLAAALAQVARELDSAQDANETLSAIVQAAQRSLTGVDHVGISITHRDGRVETTAATDHLVWQLDAAQYELREGPCLDAIRERPVVTVNNLLEHRQRWPRYVPRAAALGVRAQMGLRLYVEDETLGGLNLYALGSDSIDPDVQHTAELFATHAALALGRVRVEENLNSGLHTRKVIGQAIGILMERYDLDEDRAFSYLARVSQNSNIKLRDVAQELVRTVNVKNSRPV